MAAYTSQVAPHAGLNPVTETQPAASGNTAPCERTVTAANN